MNFIASMTPTDWIGFVGVFLILLAYFLNEQACTTNKSLLYILLNVFGAAMACLASVLLNYWPFIILEGIWAIVSINSLRNYMLKPVH